MKQQACLRKLSSKTNSCCHPRSLDKASVVLFSAIHQSVPSHHLQNPLVILWRHHHIHYTFLCIHMLLRFYFRTKKKVIILFKKNQIINLLFSQTLPPHHNLHSCFHLLPILKEMNAFYVSCSLILSICLSISFHFTFPLVTSSTSIAAKLLRSFQESSWRDSIGGGIIATPSPFLPPKIEYKVKSFFIPACLT